MSAFVEPLVAAGFRVVAFDQPGHGDSSGRHVALPDFVRAVEAIAHSHGPFVGAIGHSLGAAAIGLAVRRGLDLGRLVFVSAPASITEYAHSFARRIGIPPAIREAMRRRVERRYGMRFADIDRIEELARIGAPALLVHDPLDREVPFEHAERLVSRMPEARLVRTHGLGHYRLLRDAAVVAIASAFVAGCEAAAPEDLPPLPRPAPLY
jgi:pimeloyl-ACP methyl ester carboxylesterase